ncbi:MAG: hypothetical protein ACI8TX_003452 [Hyphomicrobiaceae bacterium]|jgi:hypothetical protein
MRYFLMFSAAVWGGYGLYCWISPEAVMEFAGISALTPTGRTEIRAMYGGLQTALGVVALSAVIRPALAPTTTAFLGAMTLGLAGARLHGLAVDGGLSEYTIGGLVFELGATTWAYLALRAGDGN